MTAEQRTATAIEAARIACAVARTVQNDRDRLRALAKDDRSPVTVADFAVQAIVALILNSRLGPCRIVGEERAAALRTSENGTLRQAVVEAVLGALKATDYAAAASANQVLDAIDSCDHDASAAEYWSLDPIDGTKGFLRGQQYAIALAHLEQHQVTTGVLGCPNLPAQTPAHVAPTREIDTPDPNGVLLVATRGGGTFQWELGSPQREQKRVFAAGVGAAATSGEDQVIRMCESWEAAHSDHDATKQIWARVGAGKNHAVKPLRIDSQCKYAVVARGEAHAYLRLPTRPGYVEKIWDHAAGMLVASEAGAIVSDIHGRALDFSHGQRLHANHGVVCAAPNVHQAVIEAIAALKIDKPDGSVEK